MFLSCFDCFICVTKSLNSNVAVRSDFVVVVSILLLHGTHCVLIVSASDLCEISSELDQLERSKLSLGDTEK